MAHFRPEITANVSSLNDGNSVSINLDNPSGHEVAFWVTGVLSGRVCFTLNGNSSWSTELPRDLKTRVVEIRQDDPMGPTLAYVEIPRPGE